MKEKLKKIWKEHKVEIIAAGVIIIGGITVIAVTKGKAKPAVINDVVKVDQWVDPYKPVLEEFGAIYKEGYDTPFADKDIAIKFLEERGKEYQLDIMDDFISVIWISKGEA